MYHKQYKIKIEKQLRDYLGQQKDIPRNLLRSMRYSLFSGGKRLRPILALIFNKALGGKQSHILPSACAIEMIHTYSLIHDDLPSMDNDDFRRGKVTNHKKFSEGTAILAGDALQSLAFEIIAKQSTHSAISLKFVLELAKGSGSRGMVAGQMMDIESGNHQKPFSYIKQTHLLKTAALFRTSTICGALSAGCQSADRRKASTFGEQIGLAFQIIDDILDHVDQLDSHENHCTFPKVLGVDQSIQMAHDTLDMATQMYPAKQRKYTEIIEYVELLRKRIPS